MLSANGVASRCKWCQTVASNKNGLQTMPQGRWQKQYVAKLPLRTDAMVGSLNHRNLVTSGSSGLVESWRNAFSMSAKRAIFDHLSRSSISHRFGSTTGPR